MLIWGNDLPARMPLRTLIGPVQWFTTTFALLPPLGPFTND